MDTAEEMVRIIKEKYNLDAPDVFSAMIRVPREKFIPSKNKNLAYTDRTISIGYGQTISQPYTVAVMTHLLDLKGDEKVLEIGTGSGYQSAILSLLCDKVFTIERISELAKNAQATLKTLGFKNVEVKIGGGEIGWKEKAPFDRILITAGVHKVPNLLFNQLKVGGILVVPIGGEDKVMTKYIKESGQKFEKSEHGIFHFVPFVETG